MNLNETKSMAENLLKYYGLSHKIVFGRSKRYYAACNHKKHIIFLSEHFVRNNDPPRVKHAILHEIAHALTPGHNHDNIWDIKFYFLKKEQEEIKI